jgi:hypothetical protein
MKENVRPAIAKQLFKISQLFSFKMVTNLVEQSPSLGEELKREKRELGKINLICVFVACTGGWLCKLETALYTFRQSEFGRV